MKTILESINGECNRRDFLKLSAGAVSMLSFASLQLPAFAKSPVAPTKLSLQECMSMSPIAMAEKSPYIKPAYEFLLKTAGEIQNPELRRTTCEILKNPAPRLLELYPDTTAKETVKQRLVAAGYLKANAALDEFLPPCSDPGQTVIPFFAAPGSGYGSHHSYPGGLATHVAVNVQASIGFFHAYKETYACPLNRDIIIAAQSLHDLHKPWVFQWQENGAARTEYPIAGTGSHHILSIAELIHRKLPSELIVAMACAHNHPGTDADESEVVGWISAASILAQQNPVKLGLLAPDGKTLPLPRRAEGFITHLGDHDWVLSVPAAKWMIAKLEEIAQKEFNMTSADLKTKKFYALRNYVFSQATLEQLYLLWTAEGETALTNTVKSIVTL
ncbi:hypothetical protein P22_2972 [Propionispora sp. 2/2-37]|uniref:TAT (twin-arginine translocation) pathway signal sequence n=1 Tax=Propionispora sp. 2/2-37 TaxID=1677858 RepID=UPI0006C4256C|nr:TAT (twin-arginine translocation) pathway signal sequence [Propionispora sp. 2/2-37]CUH96861.1 hypothetical protein P22_2972 [Propionispora sp. 2/2-37]